MGRLGKEGRAGRPGPCPWLSLPQLHLRAHAAYGSTKDVAVYNSISLSPMHIYIVGRPTKKLQQQCQVMGLTEGYTFLGEPGDT